jgi:urease accessory protein
MATVSSHLKHPDMGTPAAGGAFQTEDGWKASLKLGYAAKGGKSVLLQQERRGPLFVQKPFYPEGPRTCHTYIIHPPGGVVGGDSLSLDVTLGAGSQALITTPAAGKFYRSAGPAAVQINRLNVAADAVLEWLPQETIIYNGARAAMRTTVRLKTGAGFIGWEMLCLGLPACAELFTLGRIDQHFEIWLDGQPLLIEPLRVGPDDSLLAAPWGMAGHPAIGTLAATVQDPQVVDTIRETVSAGPDEGLFAVSRVQGLTLCRFLGDNVYAGLKLFSRTWEILRPAVKGCAACVPRIWAT